MIKCALCDNTFKDKRGLSAHVRTEHEITWNKYKTTHPITEIQDTQSPEISPDVARDPLDMRMDRLENIIDTFFNGYSPTGQPSGITNFPGESVEIIGEKINYKVALDPQIFSTYNKFKAISTKRGTPWDGDFSDFLMMSVKDAMSIHGIYDAIIEVKGNKILFEMPAGVR